MVAVSLLPLSRVCFAPQMEQIPTCFSGEKTVALGMTVLDKVMVMSKHRDHFGFGCPAYGTGIYLFPRSGVGGLFSDSSNIIGMLAGFWNNFRFCIAAHQTGKFLLSLCFTGSCSYYLTISESMLLIATFFWHYR